MRRKRGWMEGVDPSQRTWETSLGAHPAYHPFQAFTQVVPRGLVSEEEIWASGRVGAAEILPALGWALTLSKRPYSQMSCSRALVLMAMVNRTCATRSWCSDRGRPQRWPGQGLPTRSAPLRGPQDPQPHPTPVHCGGAMPGLTEGVKLACRPALLRAAGMAAWGLPL